MGASIFGLAPVNVTNANLNVSGSVVAFQSGTQITSLVSTVPSSVIVGASIFGLAPVNVTNTNINVSGSVVNFQGGIQITSITGIPSISGTVIATQGTAAAATAPWAVWISGGTGGQTAAVSTSSMLSVRVDAMTSIVGTYSEDNAHTTADRGLFVLGVRNDTVASFMSANTEYGPLATDSAGRTLIRPFAPEEARVEGYASLVSTSVTTLVPAAGTGLKNYITDIVVANTGATTTLITFRSGGGASVLGYTIAPAGGGSNLIGFQTPLMTLANQTFDFQPTSASSILFVTVKGYKAP